MASTSPIKVTRISYDSQHVQNINNLIDTNLQEKRSYLNGIEVDPPKNSIVNNY